MQVAILTAAAGLLAAALIPGGENSNYAGRMEETHRRMMKIEEATSGYMATYGHRPCPADATIDTGAANFGREAANAGTCISGTPAANLTDAGSNAVAGSVPNVTLGLPDDYAFDGFGHRITYVVDKRSTSKGSCIGLQGGSIPAPGYKGDIALYDTATSGTLLGNSMWLLLSHGLDAHGAFPMEGQGTSGGGSLANRINTNNTDTDTLKNASVDGSFNASFNNVFIKKERTDSFDDLAWTSESTKNVCCVGKVCPTIGFRIDGTPSLPGSAVNSIIATGDINGDGYPDIVFGTSDGYWGGYPQGVYIAFGKSSTIPNSSVISPDGSNLVKIRGSNVGTNFAVGDVNGDGYDDIIMTKAAAETSIGVNYGEYDFIMFGGADPWPASVSVGDFNGYTGVNGTSGIKLSNSLYDYTGFTGSYWYATYVEAGAPLIGDVDGDGRKDIIVYGSTYIGAHHLGYVLYGRPTVQWNSAVINLQTELDGTKGFQIYSSDEATYPFGTSNAYGPSYTTGLLHDLNNDGFDDIIFHEGYYTSSVYVLFGRSRVSWNLTGTNPARLDFSAEMTSGATPRSVTKIFGASYLGAWANSIFADMNGDGKQDLIFGGEYTNGIYTLFGKDAAFTWPASIDVSTLADGVNGFTITKYGSTPTESSSSFGNRLGASDVNGDGRIDLLLGDMNASPNGINQAGSIFVIYGPSGGWPGNVIPNTDIAFNGIDGFRIDGAIAKKHVWFPLAVDVNNNGKKDILCTAQGDNANPISALYGLYGKGPWAARVGLGELD